MSEKLSNLYLFSYNSLQALGWAISLLRILTNSFSTKSITGAYASSGELICLLQTVALLEVVHGAIGIVPNGVLLPLMQWGGRSHVLIAIARGIDEVKVYSSVFVTFVAWCSIESPIDSPRYGIRAHGSMGLDTLVEICKYNVLTVYEFVATFLLRSMKFGVHVIRYPNYALNCYNMSPAFLTYLRYTAFIVLFPTGLIGEMLLMYQALPYIKEKNLYGDFFAALPFSYYNFLTVLLLFYPFLWLKLYLHLLKQRRSKLGKNQKKKKK